MEYSSSLHAARRKRIQNKFEKDELDILVCSDVMARGMDLANVNYVLLYGIILDKIFLITNEIYSFFK